MHEAAREKKWYEYEGKLAADKTLYVFAREAWRLFDSFAHSHIR